MKIKEVIKHLEQLAPTQLQESYDNAGLIVGDSNVEFTQALICLDSIEEVIDEAVELGCNLVIAHHPIVFSGLKKFNGSDYIERTIIKAIKNDVAIYAIHTNLDNVYSGVNRKIGEKLGLQNMKVLSPKKNLLRKLVFYCPKEKAEEVRQKIFDEGAGDIGNYSSCSFNLLGVGTFKGNENANPYVGVANKLHEEEEQRVEVVYPYYLESKIISTLIENHPYEEVAFDLHKIENAWNQTGSGMIGDLESDMELNDFLISLKENLNSKVVRYTKSNSKRIKKVAVCGGSGSFLLNTAIQQRADVLVTADFKYHQFFDANGKIVIADIGHFESEQFTGELIQEYLQEKIPNFASYLTRIRTNPINYI